MGDPEDSMLKESAQDPVLNGESQGSEGPGNFPSRGGQSLASGACLAKLWRRPKAGCIPIA